MVPSAKWVLSQLWPWLLLFGLVIRAVTITRAVDQTSWREADVAGIARNYYREGMNPLFPRVDWRGDGPGYVEMEFPFLPWSMAVLYHGFGYDESFGRLLSFVASAASLVIFVRLARDLLPPGGAAAAILFFSLSPIALKLATALQPDGLMLTFSLAAVLFFQRSLDRGSNGSYLLALGALTLAILAKASAAHVLLLFAGLLFDGRSTAVLRDPRAWALAAVPLPALLWYSHARDLWLRYGYSLGLSNEYHWIGWDFFTNPYFIVGILRTEGLEVFTLAGALVATLSVFYGRRSPVVRLSLYWLLAAFLDYVVAARTTADRWAVYYHVASVPPAALLFGAGVEELRQWWRERAGAVPRVAGGRDLLLSLGLLAAFAAVLLQGHRALVAVQPRPEDPLRACARELDPFLPPGQMIVASGGACRDESGHPVAYNASYFFLWLDRRGFNVCLEEQSIDALRAFAARGARYFVAENGLVARQPGFAEELARTFRLRAACPEARLYELVG